MGGIVNAPTTGESYLSSGEYKLLEARVTMEPDGNTEKDECEAPESEHVAGVPDGCGCTEIWEHLSEQRAAEN